MKYLDELFARYNSLFETNILLTSLSFKLNTFFIKATFIDLSTHSYTCQKKNVKKNL